MKDGDTSRAASGDPVEQEGAFRLLADEVLNASLQFARVGDFEKLLPGILEGWGRAAGADVVILSRRSAVGTKEGPQVVRVAWHASEPPQGEAEEAVDWVAQPCFESTDGAARIRLPVGIGRLPSGLLDFWFGGRRTWTEEGKKVFGRCAELLSAMMERHQREGALDRLARALDQTAEIIMVTDEQGTIQYVNPAFSTITGYAASEVIGLNPRILKSGQHLGMFYRELWQTILRGDMWYGRFVNRRKDGTLYREEATISPVKDAAGRIVNFVATKRDITREVEIEERLRQAQKMEAMGLLASGVAHDFNNALTPILAYSELALMELDEQHPVREYIREIQECGERTAAMTRQLLSFGRKRESEFSLLDLNEVLTGLEKMIRRLIREDVEISFELVPSSVMVRADPSQLEQVIVNLLLNARDAMPGGGRLRVATREVMAEEEGLPDLAPGQHVCMEVEDSGCGMSEDVIEHIFDPFFTTKEPGRGTGLGLTTVYNIIRQHGGAITARSEPGRGSTFRVFLPISEAPAPSEGEDVPALAGARGHETVLLVEDDGDVRRLATEILHKHGYRVFDFGHPEDALGFARESSEPPDLLITDVVMPQFNGCELYRRLRETQPNLKVLYMSGHSSRTIAQLGFDAAPTQFLAKPFTMGGLTSRVREILQEPAGGQVP